MKRRPFFLVWLALFLGLTGCAAPSKMPADASVPEFILEARVAVRRGQDGFSGRLFWTHWPVRDQMEIYSPLGGVVARIEREEAEMVLYTSGRQYRARDADALFEQVLGWSLPLEGMRYWVTGAASPETPSERVTDVHGRVVNLAQQDWEILYQDFRLQGERVLPFRIKMQRGQDLEIRLIIDRWQ